MYPYANFIKNPSTINDLLHICLTKQLKKYSISKSIEIPQIDYDNFITDLCVDREYIEKNKSLCYIKNLTYHCLYIHPTNSNVGILVMCDNKNYPKFAAIKM